MNFRYILILILFAPFFGGCAYKWGFRERNLPGGYTEVAVPVFKNKTDLIGVEAKFTNSLIHELSRSKVAQVVDKKNAPVYIDGQITTISFEGGGLLDGNKAEENPAGSKLPNNTVLTTEYRALVSAQIRLIRVADQRVLWVGDFKNERLYIAPQVKLDGANTVNSLYNHSARIEVVELLAEDMMNEAHDRMIENF